MSTAQDSLGTAWAQPGDSQSLVVLCDTCPNSWGALQPSGACTSLSLWSFQPFPVLYLEAQRLRRDSQGSLPLVLAPPELWGFP